MNIEEIKRKLLVKYPFFGSIVANSNFVENQLVTTAGTDGENIYYNPNFLESINDKEQVFVFAHEVSHIAFNHIVRSEGKDKRLWNMATDAVINAFLKKDGLPLVESGVDIPEAIDYDAEEMYDKLLEEEKNKSLDSNIDNNDLQNQSNQTNTENNLDSEQNQTETKQDNNIDNNDLQNQSNQTNSENNLNSEQNQTETKQDNNCDVGHDTHSMWEKVIKKNHQRQKLQSDLKQSSNRNEEIEKLTKLGEKETFNQNKKERKRQLEELRNSLVNDSHTWGYDTNADIRNVNDIGVSKPVIDWRKLLREAIKYDVDWSYRNAEIENGIVTANLEEIPQPETEIVLDTSGSIDEGLLKNFLRECKNILQVSKMKVGCFDTEFYGFHEIKKVSDIDKLKFYGGGGTDFDVAINAFTKRVENKIIFTDGYANMPKSALNVIWVVFGEEKINPKGGKVIYIDREQLYELSSYSFINETNNRIR